MGQCFRTGNFSIIYNATIHHKLSSYSNSNYRRVTIRLKNTNIQIILKPSIASSETIEMQQKCVEKVLAIMQRKCFRKKLVQFRFGEISFEQLHFQELLLDGKIRNSISLWTSGAGYQGTTRSIISEGITLQLVTSLNGFH